MSPRIDRTEPASSIRPSMSAMFACMVTLSGPTTTLPATDAGIHP